MIAHTGLMRVLVPHATFGLVVMLVEDTWRVIDAPPIARWTLGKPAREVWDYYASRGRVQWLGQEVQTM